MHSIASTPGARSLFATSVLARLPLEMLSIGLLVQTQHLTGSFAAAGVVTGVYAIALGVGGPLLGQLVDRRGQTSALLASATVAATLLGAIAFLPAGASLTVMVALAAGIGLATPPVGACLRTQLPALLPDPSALRAAYALEASVVELTYVFGPPLALCIGALWSTGAALAVAGVVLLGATAAFAAQPASRNWRPAPTGPRPRGGSLRTPAMRTLVIVLILVGVLLGAAEVAVTAAATTLAGTTAAAPLFALWGAGSLIGGLLVTRVGGGARSAAGLALLLGALTAGHLALIPVGGTRPRSGRRAAFRRRRDRADRSHRLRDGRPRRPSRNHDRGVRLARHRDGSRRRRRSGRRWDPRRPRRACSSVRARRRRRRSRGAHHRAAVAHPHCPKPLARKRR